MLMLDALILDANYNSFSMLAHSKSTSHFLIRPHLHLHLHHRLPASLHGLGPVSFQRMLMIPRPSPNSDTIQQDKAAVLVYLRMRHKDPYRGYVLCGVVRPFPLSFYLGGFAAFLF